MLPASEPAIMSGVIEPVRELLAIALFVGVLVSMGRRWLAATQLQRRTIAPVMVMGALSIVLLAAFFAARRLADDTDTARTLGTLWGLCVAGIAAAFFVGLVRRRLLLGRVLAELAVRLSDGADLAAVRDALASALGDPTLEVLIPDGPVGWRDADGEPASLPAAADGRGVTIVRDAGEPGGGARPRPGAALRRGPARRGRDARARDRAPPARDAAARQRAAGARAIARGGSPRPPTRSARGSSATSTTARSSA